MADLHRGDGSSESADGAIAEQPESAVPGPEAGATYSRDPGGPKGGRRRDELRPESPDARLRCAAARDAAAHARDVAAAARDQIAELRDRELTAHDAAWVDEEHASQPTGAQARRRAAQQRGVAAEARALAADDREQAARDRERAARDRLEAQADRELLRHQLAIAETDALTGARTRASGLVDLEHEIARARRSGEQLAVAYVDVVGLKAVNDRLGHVAGDELLTRVVEVIRENLRPYDLIVRLGGDEFLCAMPGATSQHARQRFRAIRGVLASQPKRSDIKAGFAALQPRDDAAELIRRADAELIGERRTSAAGRDHHDAG